MVAVVAHSTARSALTQELAKGDDAVNRQAMIDLFDRHVNAELAANLDETMATMNDNPYLNHVPTMAGGIERAGVLAFYRDHLVGKFFPPDVKMTPVSRTVGETSIVDETFIGVVGFKGGKISHEHICWDQASVLVQVGPLDPKGLPVAGAEVARKVRDPSLPPRRF